MNLIKAIFMNCFVFFVSALDEKKVERGAVDSSCHEIAVQYDPLLAFDVRMITHGRQAHYNELVEISHKSLLVEDMTGDHVERDLRVYKIARTYDSPLEVPRPDPEHFLKKGGGIREPVSFIVGDEPQIHPSSSRIAMGSRTQSASQAFHDRIVSLKKNFHQGSQSSKVSASSSLDDSKHQEAPFDDYAGSVPQDITHFLDYLKNPLRYEKFNIQRFGSILLYGAPGTGKTHLARLLAREADCIYVYVSAEELMNSYIGQSAENARTLFQVAHDAGKAENKHVIIYIDEFDSIAADRTQQHVGERHAIVAQLLSLMDGFEKDQENKVTVIAATNLPQVLDQGIYRRFRMSIEMTPPDDEGLFKLIMLYGGKHRYEPVMLLQTLSHAFLQELAKGVCLEDLVEAQKQSYLAIKELVILTRGATPALIKSTFETAAIKAAFDKKDVIEHASLLETFKVDMKRYQREEKLRKARILFAFGRDVDDENLSYFI